MERLTEKITNKETNEILAYRALPDVRNLQVVQHLGQYEDTGLTPEQVQQLKERDTEKRVDISSRCEEHTHYKCPTCGNILMTEYKGYRIGRITEFCDKCGQRLESGE